MGFTVTTNNLEQKIIVRAKDIWWRYRGRLLRWKLKLYLDSGSISGIKLFWFQDINNIHYNQDVVGTVYDSINNAILVDVGGNKWVLTIDDTGAYSLTEWTTEAGVVLSPLYFKDSAGVYWLMQVQLDGSVTYASQTAFPSGYIFTETFPLYLKSALELVIYKGIISVDGSLDWTLVSGSGFVVNEDQDYHFQDIGGLLGFRQDGVMVREDTDKSISQLFLGVEIPAGEGSGIVLNLIDPALELKAGSGWSLGNKAIRSRDRRSEDYKLYYWDGTVETGYEKDLVSMLKSRFTPAMSMVMAYNRTLLVQVIADIPGMRELSLEWLSGDLGIIQQLGISVSGVAVSLVVGGIVGSSVAVSGDGYYELLAADGTVRMKLFISVSDLVDGIYIVNVYSGRFGEIGNFSGIKTNMQLVSRPRHYSYLEPSVVSRYEEDISIYESGGNYYGDLNYESTQAGTLLLDGIPLAEDSWSWVSSNKVSVSVFDSIGKYTIIYDTLLRYESGIIDIGVSGIIPVISPSWYIWNRRELGSGVVQREELLNIDMGTGVANLAYVSDGKKENAELRVNKGIGSQVILPSAWNFVVNNNKQIVVSLSELNQGEVYVLTYNVVIPDRLAVAINEVGISHSDDGSVWSNWMVVDFGETLEYHRYWKYRVTLTNVLHVTDIRLRSLAIVIYDVDKV